MAKDKNSSVSHLRDLLYLDFDKAASIWSQFDEGLLKDFSVTEDSGKDKAAGTKFGFPGIAEANLGVDYIQKRSTLHSKTLHHDVLNRVEKTLEKARLVTDLSSLPADEWSPDVIRESLEDRPYLRAQGWSVIEDYKKMLGTMTNFNPLLEFIGKCNEQKLKTSSEYLEFENIVKSLKDEIQQTKDRNQRMALSAKLKEAEKSVRQMTIFQSDKVPDWLTKGITLLIETFMPTRINFRIYPFSNCPSFQVLCNLKRECFVDSNLEHLLYGYGSRPNVRLAVFGLITSIPAPEGTPIFDLLDEFKDETLLTPNQVLEAAFRRVFMALDDVEAFVRYSRYPNVTIHPIAVYRSFESK
jgi:hypothetical protein